MVSKHMRRYVTAGDQATGVDDCGNPRENSELFTRKKDTSRLFARHDGMSNELGSENGQEDDDKETGIDKELRVIDRRADSERVFPAPTSVVASLNRELRALETRYFRTRLNLEKATDKNDELRREMKKAAADATKHEREILKLRHLIDRIQSERKQLEQQAIYNRDYAKKIEHRFYMGTKGQSLAQCNLELSSQLRASKDTVKKKAQALEKCQHELEEAQSKLAIVQRALETRLESYELNGSLHTGLLFELAKRQDDSEALALQLSHERKHAAALIAQLKQSQKREKKLEEAQTVRESWVATLEKERAALDDRLAKLAEEVQTAACEKSTLLRFIHEQAEAKFQLEARLKDEQTQRHQELERAQDALQVWEEERRQLQSSTEIAQYESERLRAECERVAVAIREQEDIAKAQRVREADMKLEVEKLETARRKSEEDFIAAKEVCRELQGTVEQHEESSRLLRSEIDALETTKRELLGKLETKESEERALREAMENALQDLAALSKQRNDAAKAMSEAVTISASSLEEQQALERQINEQRTQIDKLKNAKNLLQNAMLEQLAALRKQLHVERRHRIEVEARLKQMKSPAVAAHRGKLGGTDNVDALQIREATDSEMLQPLPPPSPSPAVLPLSHHHSESATLSSMSSSASSSDDDMCDAFEDRISPTKSVQTAQGPVQADEVDEANARLSLLELAGEMDNYAYKKTTCDDK